MKQSALQSLLTECAADRLAIIKRLEAAAAVVAHYDFNNTYQYVINRQETHLRWLVDALSEYGAGLPQPSRTLPLPVAPKAKTIEPSLYRSILEEDARELGAFAEKWRPRLHGIEHVRHRKMLDVIVGETLEHQRLFEQGAAGYEDVLGRRTGGVPRQGAVLPTRWLE